MFAYCLNNPVCRKDIPGTTSVECKEDDGDLTDNDKDIAGGNMSNGTPANKPVSAGTGDRGTDTSGVGGGDSPVPSLNPADPAYNGEVGPSKAPPTSPTGTVYTQVSSDGKNTIVSQTVYGEHNMPAYRIDYNHSHGEIGPPHIHYFFLYNGPNGVFLNKGPTLPYQLKVVSY